MKNLNNWLGGAFILVAILVIIRAQKNSSGPSSLISSAGNVYGNTVRTLEGNGGNTNGVITNLGNSLNNAISNLNVNSVLGGNS